MLQCTYWGWKPAVLLFPRRLFLFRWDHHSVSVADCGRFAGGGTKGNDKLVFELWVGQNG